MLEVAGGSFCDDVFPLSPEESKRPMVQAQTGNVEEGEGVVGRGICSHFKIEV